MSNVTSGPDGKLKGDQFSLFKSAKTVGTGANQNIAHGLGRVPVVVIPVPLRNTAGTAYNLIEGAHTSTNIVINVEANTEFIVIAF